MKVIFYVITLIFGWTLSLQLFTFIIPFIYCFLNLVDFWTFMQIHKNRSIFHTCQNSHHQLLTAFSDQSSKIGKKVTRKHLYGRKYYKCRGLSKSESSQSTDKFHAGQYFCINQCFLKFMIQIMTVYWTVLIELCLKSENILISKLLKENWNSAK